MSHQVNSIVSNLIASNKIDMQTLYEYANIYSCQNGVNDNNDRNQNIEYEMPAYANSLNASYSLYNAVITAAYNGAYYGAYYGFLNAQNRVNDMKDISAQTKKP